MKRCILTRKILTFTAVIVLGMTLFAANPGSKKLKVLVLTGTPYQRGLQHGKILKKEIAELVQKWKKYFIEKSFKIDADLYIKKFLEKNDFMPAIKKWTPGLLEEIKGIADGSGIDFNTIYAFQLLDEIWTQRRDVIVRHCTGIGVNRQGNIPTMAGQNYDIPEYFHGYHILLHIKYENSDLEAFVFSLPGFIASNGMNNRPVSVHVNAVQQLEYSNEGLPVAFVIRALLKQDSYEKAAAFLHAVKHASGQNYIISGIDKSSSFECSAQKVCQFIPFKGAELNYHTNHPLVNDNYSRKYLARLKKAGKTNKQGLRRHNRFESLEKRFKHRVEPVTLKDIKSTLSSRDTGSWDICNSYTSACTIMVLSKKPELHISPGQPDVTPFEIFTFSKDK